MLSRHAQQSGKYRIDNLVRDAGGRISLHRITTWALLPEACEARLKTDSALESSYIHRCIRAVDAVWCCLDLATR